MIVRRRFHVGAFACLVCLILLGLRNARAQTYAGTEADLRGTIRLVAAYGAPGFGEDPKHDQKISYLVVQTGRSVDLPCPDVAPSDRTEDCRKTRRLKLQFFHDPEGKLEKYAFSLQGRRVLIHGKLSRRVIANDYTPIVCEVASIKPQPR